MLFSFAVLCSAFVSCIFDLHLGHTFLSLSHFIPLQFNWYTRRAVLTGVYNTTELVMMQDSSPDFEDTWRFLENRVADAMNMGNTANQVTQHARYMCSVSHFSPNLDAARPGFLIMQNTHLVLMGDCIAININKYSTSINTYIFSDR